MIRALHQIREAAGLPAVDTVRNVFTEGKPVYPGSGFDDCIKGVFRVTQR